MDAQKETEGSDKDSEISRGKRTPRNKDAPVGILRLDINRPRRSSSEFRYLTQGEPPSPQPSVDRLSVTFAEDSVKSDSSTRCNLYNPRSPLQNMEKVHFPTATDEEDSDEDYSASVTAILQRRASSKKLRRRNSRRASSPFSPDILPGSDGGRRRSSVITTSSGDTAITMDEMTPEVTQEQIFENIKLHKEVLSNVKMQPWNMRKKLRLVVQAKNYVKRHEGALQERLAQSKSTRDILARCNIYLIQKWQHYRRELANLSNLLIPWELRIKEIESHFGSVVASYFIFLRWIFWVNLVIATILLAFVAVPEMLTASHNTAGERKAILEEDKYNSTNFLTLWDFEGVFKYSPLFYGYYTNRDDQQSGYRLPLAYFLTGLVVYVYSFVATLRKMAENSRMSKLSEKDDECVFTWKLFTGWDYMIGNPETAHNRVASIVMGFKEALLEEAEKKREKRNWKVIGIRVLVNAAVVGLFILSALAVFEVVRRSTEPEATNTVWRRNEITVVMTLISTFFPIFFEVLGIVEKYHPRKQLRIQLARIMVLYLLNLYSLIFALFDKISDMTIELQQFKPNVTPIPVDPVIDSGGYSNSTLLSTALTTQEVVTYCYEICDDSFSPGNLMQLASNFSATFLPKIFEIVNNTLSSDLYENVTEFYNSTNQNDALNLTDSEDFQDYLMHILAPFSVNFSNSTELNNYTDSIFDNFTTKIYDLVQNSTFDLNLTSEIERVSTELTTIFDEISSTVSFQDETIPERNCERICSTEPPTNFPTTVGTLDLLDQKPQQMNYSMRTRLRSLCWETMFGQELVKLTVLDLVMTALSTLAVDFFRGVFVRIMNNCWCWDLEKKFPQYGDFKVAENILHLVNNQGLVWMGLFFSPGLVVLNVVKLYVLMYLRSWAVLTCNVPHEVIFRASRSNNFYFALLLTMLFLCVLPVGYAIVWVEPSWHCGPFSNYQRIFHIFTKTIRRILPESLHRALDYVASPGIVIPLLVLLTLIIYYLISLTNALREANNDLKIQLRQERTEERRKMFQIADRRRRGGSGGSGDLDQTPFTKWKKLLHGFPTGKSFDETPKQESMELPEEKEENKVESHKTKAIIANFFKRALGKPSVTSDEDNPIQQDDATDSEQHESLPEDVISLHEKKEKAAPQSSFHKTVTVALSHKQKSKPEASPKDSSDSSDLKRTKSDIPRKHKTNLSQGHTFDLRKPRDHSPEKDSSIKSDSIPVITISKTESAECILEHRPDKSGAPNDEKKDELVSTSSDTIVDTKPKIKYVLKKQTAEIDAVSVCGKGNLEDEVRGKKGVGNQRSSTTSESVTKTESSGCYKDESISQ